MNSFWCYKRYLVRSSEHLCFSLTALYLLLVFFHFKNESTDLINWDTCLFSPLFTLRHMLFLTTVYKDISQNMHFDVVLSEFIRPCSKKQRRAQFSIHAELTQLSLCVHFRCVCVRVLQMCVCERCLFILQISIFYTWHRCIVSAYIVSIYRSISMNPYTPNRQ